MNDYAINPSRKFIGNGTDGAVPSWPAATYTYIENTAA